MTLKKVAARLKAGYGQGHGEFYIPFLSARDVASKGRSHRPFGFTTGRTYQFLSDVEHNHFLIFDNEESCVDIREQYPLPLDATQELAERLGIKHPRAPGADYDHQMTTDLVITRQHEGYQSLHAYAIKRFAELAEERVQQKLAIERRYWVEQGIEFSELTERDYPRHLIRSLMWLQPRREMDIFVEPVAGYWDELAIEVLQGLVVADEDMRLNEFCIGLDRQYSRNPGAHLGIARHMLACRALAADLNYHNLWSIPVGMISVTPYAIDKWAYEEEDD